MDLGDGSEPIPLWHDPERWSEERRRHSPAATRWRLCELIHRSNWGFAGRDPVVTPRSLWDLRQLVSALRPITVASGLLTGLTMADLLGLCGCGDDPRLRRFLTSSSSCIPRSRGPDRSSLRRRGAADGAGPAGALASARLHASAGDQLVQAIESQGGQC